MYQYKWLENKNQKTKRTLNQINSNLSTMIGTIMFMDNLWIRFNQNNKIFTDLQANRISHIWTQISSINIKIELINSYGRTMKRMFCVLKWRLILSPAQLIMFRYYRRIKDRVSVLRVLSMKVKQYKIIVIIKILILCMAEFKVVVRKIILLIKHQ